MDSVEETRTQRTKDCDLCIGDDDRIQVSVSPRRFSLPPTSEKKKKMEIRNKNPYPIYFKAGTSNMDAFRPQPNTGRIPPNSKVSVVVQFFDSVIPVRRHEEVVVMTSVRPFEACALHNDKICPYCCTVHVSKYHQPKKLIYPSEHFLDQEEYQYIQGGRNPQYTVSECSVLQNSKEQFQENKDAQTSKKRTYKTDYTQKNFTNEISRIKTTDEQSEHQKNNQRARKVIHADGKTELEEICLHAFIHRPISGRCDCNNCAELIIGQNAEVKIKDFQHGKVQKARRVSDPTPVGAKQFENELYTISEKKEAKMDKEVIKTLNRKSLSDELKEKVREAHILTRIVKGDSMEISDTETSEVSAKDSKQLKKRTKFISEEDFKKKLEKVKFKKHQKQLEEESKSTTTTEDTIHKKEPPKIPEKKVVQSMTTRKERRGIIMDVNAKLTTILHLIWANFIILLLLLILVIGFIVFVCTSSYSKQSGIYRIPCLYNLFMWRS